MNRKTINIHILVTSKLKSHVNVLNLTKFTQTRNYRVNKSKEAKKLQCTKTDKKNNFVQNRFKKKFTNKASISTFSFYFR